MHVEIRTTDSEYSFDCLVENQVVGQFTDAEFGRYVATFDSPSNLACCFEALGADTSDPKSIARALAYSILMCAEDVNRVSADGVEIS